MAERVWLRITTFPKLRCAPAEERFCEAARHDLFARADFHGELYAGNLQPGGYSTGVVKLHRLSRQRGELSNAPVEPEAWCYEPQPVGFYVHAGEGAVGEISRAHLWSSSDFETAGLTMGHSP